MRSRQEIQFRLRQEAVNLGSLAFPPGLPGGEEACERPMGLPPVSVVIDSLRGSHFAEAVISLAGDILAHRFPLFGSVLDTGPEIHWRRDYERGVETRPVYFRLLPYLDAARAGDHKYIWELSRHQHLVVLAQAFRFNGRREFLEEIQAQLESWMSRTHTFAASIG